MSIVLCHYVKSYMSKSDKFRESKRLTSQEQKANKDIQGMTRMSYKSGVTSYRSLDILTLKVNHVLRKCGSIKFRSLHTIIMKLR